MNALSDIVGNCGNALSCAWQVLRYLGSFLWLLLQPKPYRTIKSNTKLLSLSEPARQLLREAGKNPLLRPRLSRHLPVHVVRWRRMRAAWVRGVVLRTGIASSR